MSNAIDNLNDDTILQLKELLDNTLAERKRKQEEERKRVVLVQISLAEMESCWKYGCRGGKIVHVEKYMDSNSFYFVATLKGMGIAILEASRMHMAIVGKRSFLPNNVRLVPKTKDYGCFTQKIA